MIMALHDSGNNDGRESEKKVHSGLRCQGAVATLVVGLKGVSLLSTTSPDYSDHPKANVTDNNDAPIVLCPKRCSTHGCSHAPSLLMRRR